MAIYEIPQDSKIWIENELNKKYSSDKAEEKYREIIEVSLRRRNARGTAPHSRSAREPGRPGSGQLVHCAVRAGGVGRRILYREHQWAPA